jgi:hypothetical protein
VSLTVTLYETDARETEVASTAYSQATDETVHVTAFTLDGWVVIRTGERPVWEGAVGPAYYISLWIDSEGEVVTAELVAV